jgi:aspartate/glutamate racemase
MGPLAAADFLTKLVAETPATRDQDHIPYIAWGVPQIPDRRSHIRPRRVTAAAHAARHRRSETGGRVAWLPTTPRITVR